MEKLILYPGNSGCISYSSKIYIDKYILQLNFSNSITGCGLGMMSGFAFFVTKSTVTDLKNKACFQRIREAIKEVCKSGAFPHKIYGLIATLGQRHDRSNEEFLAECGFKKMIDYNNKNDGANYMQAVYFLDINTI